MAIYLGLDFGTSGARLMAIDGAGAVVHRDQTLWQSGDLLPQWRGALAELLAGLPKAIAEGVGAIALNGTSATVLLCEGYASADRTGQPLTPPLLYNDDRGQAVAAQLRDLAPPDHWVQSATSSLAKLLWWAVYVPEAYEQGAFLLHQADWLAAQLHGQWGISDYHNALKLGYDVENLAYPHWLQNWPGFNLCPQVVEPGTPLGTITPKAAAEFGLPRNCVICAGTTDSIAAFLASGASTPGQAVTSLGSTLVLKLLSDRPIMDLNAGVYSHRLGELWLTGGASNTGGAVLRHFFTPAELVELSNQIDPQVASPYDYYPLLKPGDRFPINDPHLPPRLDPRPA
ncbi:MAG: carbohydrate kinase, partial [Spirulina sp. DLM2.Bin59]